MKKQALAIVDDSQFSLAIGKQGQNVRLANRLCDWNIDVKTVEQCADMDLSDKATSVAARNLFNDDVEEEELTTVSELPGVNAAVAAKLKENGIEDIVHFMESYETLDIDGVSKEDLDAVYALIKENVEFVEEQDDATASDENTDEPQEEEKYFCPECGAEITLDMTHCPKCGVEFEFTEDEE